MSDIIAAVETRASGMRMLDDGETGTESTSSGSVSPAASPVPSYFDLYRSSSYVEGLVGVREHVLANGLSAMVDGLGKDPRSINSLRLKVWKILLCVPAYMDVESYSARAEVTYS